MGMEFEFEDRVEMWCAVGRRRRCLWGVPVENGIQPRATYKMLGIELSDVVKGSLSWRISTGETVSKYRCKKFSNSSKL
jgi:hypothetical protein